jgi:hypothetical protein
VYCLEEFLGCPMLMSQGPVNPAPVIVPIVIPGDSDEFLGWIELVVITNLPDCCVT